MAFNVFELFAKLGIDTSEYDKGLASAETAGSAFGSGLKTATKIATAAIATATTAVVGFGTKSVQTGMEFDTAMSQVAATMGLTTEQMNAVGGDFERLRDFAQEMGSSTMFSATQAAEGLNYMALAGYDAETSISMLPTVLNLAASGAMELGAASDMVTDAQTALGLSIEDTTVLVDQMARTASTTNTSVSQLGEAILTIGGTAQYMAGGTTELNQVLGILADNGIKGSEAGTHLRNMLLKLSAPTKEGADMIKELGLQVFDANGNLRSFDDIFGQLSTTMEDFTDEQRMEAFSALFNTRDIAAATALLNTNEERWNEVATAIDKASGAAETMAEVQLDNLGGDITIFKSALEGAQIAISDSLTPELRGFVQFGTESISSLTEAFKEGGIEGLFGELGNVITEGTSMIIQELPTIVRAGGELLKSVAQGIMDNLPALLDAAVEIVTELATFLADNAENIAPAILTIVETILMTFNDPTVRVPLGEAGMEIIIGLITGFADAMPDLIAMIPDLMQNVMISIGAENENLASFVVDLIGSLGLVLLGVIGGILGMSMDEIKNSILNLGDNLAEFGDMLVTDIGNWGADRIEDIVSFFADLGTSASEGLDDILSSIGDFGADVIDSFFSTFDDVKETVASAIDYVKGLFDFDWSLPQIKLPHFKISGGEAPWGFAGQGSFPSVSVQWYKKAMNAPMLLDSATIFGYAGGRALGGGEAGDEMIYGRESLMKDIAEVVDDRLSKLQFVVPVYLGTNKIDQQIVTAKARADVISGGR